MDGYVLLLLLIPGPQTAQNHSSLRKPQVLSQWWLITEVSLLSLSTWGSESLALPTGSQPQGCCGNTKSLAGLGSHQFPLGSMWERAPCLFPFLFLFQLSSRSSFQGFQDFLIPSGPKSKSWFLKVKFLFHLDRRNNVSFIFSLYFSSIVAWPNIFLSALYNENTN